ncbi:hypothetical protein PLESTB_000437500 [Pleodorina starrii]|uniref:Uncharacterized protein n=1 Tax=Pleodorina starrii TaxID=330485 RepID=A0A9W6BF07_9CHLO|nr:hypothetical protein PLESTB_000437500 [Pleodorina starrii]GLC73968.1 hypothetical protein PLESTF_001443000 [Pleodorina starrii]
MNIAESSCSSPLWQKLPFLPQPPTPGFNPTGWSSAQFTSYAKSTILQTTAVSVAFVGIAVVLLVFFLAWRLYGGIMCCFSVNNIFKPRLARRKRLLAYEVMHDPWLRGHKVAYAFFAVGCVILAITGLITLPRPLREVGDLATRLEATSVFASSLLAASDGLLGAAASVRPASSAVDTALEFEEIGADLRCASKFLDSGLARTANLLSQIAVLASALTQLSPTVATTAAAIDATMAPAPFGATPSMAVVADMPTLIWNINNTLGSYESALAALPASRHPTITSDPLITALQSAQGALNITGWLDSLDILIASTLTMKTVAEQGRYEQLGNTVEGIQAAALAILPPADALAISLTALDTLYLGTSQPGPSGTAAGRACMLSLVRRLTNFDSAMFQFSSSLERSAIDTILAVADTLERMYGVNGTATGSEMQLPVPLSTTPLQTSNVLSSLVNFNATTFATRCDMLQGVLQDNFGESNVPDLTALQSYLSLVRSTLRVLQMPSDGVQAALAAYASFPSDPAYNALITAVNATRPALRDARSAAIPLLPSGSYNLASNARRITELAGSSNEDDFFRTTAASVNIRLIRMANNLTIITNWIADNNNAGGLALLSRVTTGLTMIQTALGKAQTLFNQSGWAVPAPASDGASGSSPPPRPATIRVSAFLQPLLVSMQLIASTLASGFAAVAEQLDNALGKVLITSSPPPQPPSPPAGRRRLQQSSSESANVTTVVRRELTQRLDDLVVMLRGKPARKYSEAGFSSAVAIYSSVTAVCLLLGAAMYFNFPFGLVVGLGVHLLLVTLVLVGAWAAAAGMVVTHDACGNVDSLVLDAVSPSSPLFSLVRYYLQGIGGGLVTVLRTTGLGDTPRLNAVVSALQTRVLNPLLLPQPPDPGAFAANSTGPWPGSLGTVQTTLGALLVNLADLAADVLTYLNTLLTQGERTVVLAQYNAVTSWACCGLGGQFLVAWVCATGCGLLAWLAGLSGLLVLKNLDDMPVGRRCGFTCYDARDFMRPARRRRSQNGGGGRCGSSSDGGVGSAPHLRYPPPAFIQPNPLSSYGDGEGAAVASATIHLNNPQRSTYEKASSPRENVVDAPLFQGPMHPPASVAERGTPHSEFSATSVGIQPPLGGLQVNVLAMDPDTARAFGYGVSERGSGGGVPSSRPSPRLSPSRPAPPPPAGSLPAYRRSAEEWPQF